MPPCLFSCFYNGEVKAQKHLGSEGNQHAAMKDQYFPSTRIFLVKFIFGERREQLDPHSLQYDGG
jgi:hypothetical protein